MSENFEEKLVKAKEILEKLNSPEITLEQSVEAYKNGIKILEEASKLLEDAKLSYEEAKA